VSYHRRRSERAYSPALYLGQRNGTPVVGSGILSKAVYWREAHPYWKFSIDKQDAGDDLGEARAPHTQLIPVAKLCGSPLLLRPKIRKRSELHPNRYFVDRRSCEIDFHLNGELAIISNGSYSSQLAFALNKSPIPSNAWRVEWYPQVIDRFIARLRIRFESVPLDFTDSTDPAAQSEPWASQCCWWPWLESLPARSRYTVCFLLREVACAQIKQSRSRVSLYHSRWGPRYPASILGDPRSFLPSPAGIPSTATDARADPAWTFRPWSANKPTSRTLL